MANISIDQMSATLFSEASDVSETTFLMEILEPLSAELGMFCFAVFIYTVFTGSTLLGSSRAKNAALKAKISKTSSPPVSGSKKGMGKGPFNRDRPVKELSRDWQELSDEGAGSYQSILQAIRNRDVSTLLNFVEAMSSEEASAMPQHIVAKILLAVTKSEDKLELDLKLEKVIIAKLKVDGKVLEIAATEIARWRNVALSQRLCVLAKRMKIAFNDRAMALLVRGHSNDAAAMKNFVEEIVSENSPLTLSLANQLAAQCTSAGQHHLAQLVMERCKAGPPEQEVNQTIKSIRDAGKAGHLDEAFQAFKGYTNQDQIPAILYNCLIQACMDCQSLESAAVVFAKLKSAAKVDVVSYNTMIKGYARDGDFENSMRLMKEMKDSGLAPNKVTYHAVMYALTDQSALWSLVNEMQSSNIGIDEYTCAILLKGVKNRSQAPQISRILALFDAFGATMDQTMIVSLFEACHRSECLRFFSDRVRLMLKSSQMPKLTAQQYANTIRAFGQAWDLDMVWTMWRQMEQWDVKPTIISVGWMVEALVANSKCDAAWKLIGEISKSPEYHKSVNSITFATLIKGFASSRQHERVLEVVEMMKSQSIDSTTSRNYQSLNTVIYNTIINSLVHLGRTDEITNILEDMQNASPPVSCDIVTYSTIIKGYCHSGQLEKALEMWESMKKYGLVADEMMYNIIIDGCAKASMGNHALMFFEDMKAAGVAPTCFTLSILVKVLGRLKRVDEAFDLVASLTSEHGFKANIQVWTCLLQACIVTRNPARALMVHDLILKDGTQPDVRTYTALATGMIHCKQTHWAMNVIRCAYHLPGHTMPMTSGPAVGVEWSLIEQLKEQNSPIIHELQMAGVKLEPTSSARFPSRKYEGPRFKRC
eukprot:TRINITY_DN97_c0_g1_i1.p1 TRINITY_DN97_c0_g1~~TRINITY_DN97_c0_g1_i1.p1  ORF type:complete len:878 (+),score=204.69 TRINITY_DN97_c0_g1_i1:230-2863(+)